MPQTLAVSKELPSMSAVEKQFHLTYATDDRFFREWFESLPDLTEHDLSAIAHLQQRFLEHRNRGALPEGTVVDTPTSKESGILGSTNDLKIHYPCGNA